MKLFPEEVGAIPPAAVVNKGMDSFIRCLEYKRGYHISLNL